MLACLTAITKARRSVAKLPNENFHSFDDVFNAIEQITHLELVATNNTIEPALCLTENYKQWVNELTEASEPLVKCIRKRNTINKRWDDVAEEARAVLKQMSDLKDPQDHDSAEFLRLDARFAFLSERQHGFSKDLDSLEGEEDMARIAYLKLRNEASTSLSEVETALIYAMRKELDLPTEGFFNHRRTDSE